MPNRLAREASPYLRQHADNPVDWYPWGKEALERARREGKPIFLSIGYSACHWCHVMERESFEDPEIARILNEHFVSVKVDREERPDIDSVYMESVQAMTGSGGWPMSVFLTPDRKPFFGGTYFPPEDRHGLPSFRRVILGAAEAYRKERAGVEERAEALASRLGRSLPLRGEEELRPSVSESAARRLAEDFDPKEGGFGGAPKFPQPMNLEFLLRHARRTGDGRALHMAVFSLEKMAEGGIYDHLGGGFHRYSTDARWLVPHFEKMLYDNAELALLAVHLYRMTGRPLFREVAKGTLDYVLREMTSPEGAFYSAQDADSEGEEGSFFLWTEEEILRALGEKDGRLFALAYGVRARGDFEGRNILHRRRDPELAERTGVSAEEIEEKLRSARAALFTLRENRPRPTRDDKVIAGWNGLMIGALAEAAEALGDERYREAAVRTAAFAESALFEEGRLRHQWIDGAASGWGFLEDHAFLGEGLVALYQATFDVRWFRFAGALAEAILERFAAGEDGGFFDAARDHETPIARPRNVQDNAVPSGNASATRFLLLMASYTGEERFGSPARRAVLSMQDLMERHPIAFGHWLGSLEFLLGPPREVAIVGERGSADAEALLRAAGGGFHPNQVVAFGDPREKGVAIPLLDGRRMIEGAATAYVCRSFMCKAPILDPEKLATELAG